MRPETGAHQQRQSLSVSFQRPILAIATDRIRRLSFARERGVQEQEQ